MTRLSTRRSVLEVAEIGAGEAVLFIHGAFFGGAIGSGVFDRLCDEPALRDRYRLITYDRHGYGASSKPTEPYTLDDVVTDAWETLHWSGAVPAHVLAHSAGCVYGLQLAMTHPEAVHSLTLVEPNLPTPEWGQFLAEHFAPAGEALARGDSQAAFDISFEGVYGSREYRTELRPELPERSFEQAVEDIENLFTYESSALRQFSFDAEDASRIRQPVLLVRGDRTVPVWFTHHERLRAWMPHAEEHVVRDGNHFSPVLRPDDLAQGLSSFLSAHPIRTGSPDGR